MNYEFNCDTININDWKLRNKKLIQHAELRKMFCSAEEYMQMSENKKQNCFEFNLPYETAILNLNRFVSCMQVKLKQICRYEKFNEFTSNASVYDFNFYSIRRSICEFVVYVCTYLDSINWNHDFIQSSDLTRALGDFHLTIRRYLSRLYNLPDSLLNYAASSNGNSCLHPGYHIYHLHLELRWLYLVFLYSRLKSENIMEENDELNNTITLIIYDLIYIALKGFIKRISMKDELKTRSPYTCTCTREMWYMLQILIEDMRDKGYTKRFWDYVNIALNNLKIKSSDKQIYWHHDCEKVPVDIKSFEMFAIWIIYHVNLLYGYQYDGSYSTVNTERVKSNHSELENLLKSYINKAGQDESTEKELCAIIPLIHILIIEWWESDTKVIKTLLDYFQSRINQQYLLQAFGPWSVAFDNKTPLDILKQAKNRVQGTESNKESSFGLFLRLIGQFLHNNNIKYETKFWNQIKGRIYIKFNIKKVQDLTEDGLYNFLSMFLTLAIYADPVDVCLKIMSIPINFTDASQRKNALIFKVKLAVLLLYKELDRDFKELKLNENKDNFLKEINQISCMKTTIPLMKYFIEVLNTIIKSNSRLDKNEHVLFDGYLDRYLSKCPKDTFALLSDTICLILENCRIQRYENHPILDALWNYIPSRIRQMALESNLCDDFENIVKLAFIFTAEAIHNPTISERHKHSANSLFQHFGFSIMIKNIKIILKYLVQVLSDSNILQNLRQKTTKFDQNIVQAWIRVSIMVGDEEDNDLKRLKNFVMNVNDVREIFITPSVAQLFRNSSTPFCDFLRSLMEKRKTVQNKAAFDDKWRVYFQKIEKWAFTSITKENVESNETQKIYKCISLLIFYCSPIFYMKNQPQNMLKLLISASMLPHEDKAYLKQAGKRIFSMVLLGLECLNVESDFNLHPLLQNLLEQYLPLLVTGTTNNFVVQDVLLNCFTETQDSYLKVIFAKLANFIVVPTENTTHKYCYLVMILLTNLARDGNRFSSKLIELMISTCVPFIINCFMKVPEIHPHKKQTIDLFRVIFNNRHYMNNQSIKHNFESIIMNFIYKHITVNTPTTFTLLNSLTLLNTRLVLNTLPKIQQIIAECERTRRPNTSSLKYSFEKLKEEIKKRTK